MVSVITIVGRYMEVIIDYRKVGKHFKHYFASIADIEYQHLSEYLKLS